MFDRIWDILEKTSRGVIAMSCLACGVAVAVLAAAVLGVGCYRVWQFIWAHFLGFSWGGK